jgi:DNA repair exonuclease SbcCD nuclease subunit
VPAPITVLHTADWQIGKPYGRVSDPDKRSRLRQVRLEAIVRIAALAQRCQAQAVVVAGDLFDSATPSPSDVSAVCAAVGQIPCPTLVIPGNHDHGAPGGIWHSPLLAEERQRRAPNLQVLLERTPCQLDGLLVLPCGLRQRHESEDPCAWLERLDWSSLPSQTPRLVLAHGGVTGFAATDLDDENPASAANLLRLNGSWLQHVDYVALGDWHGCKQVNAKAWYSGTPEPDRFPRSSDYCSGQVLSVTLQRGTPPQVQQHSTAQVGWHSLEIMLTGDGDLERLEQRVEALLGNRVGQDLLLLNLRGDLSLGGQQRLQGLLERWQAQLLRLKQRGAVGLTPQASEITALTTLADAPLVASVARSLQHRLSQLNSPTDAVEAENNDADLGERQLLAQALLELHRCLNQSEAPCA